MASSNSLINKLVQLRGSEKNVHDIDDELAQVCNKLAEVFTLESFAKAINIITNKINQAKQKYRFIE